MKKAVTFFCLAFFFALPGKSQIAVPLKFQEKLQQLAFELPAQPPANALVQFAKTLIGIPYRYASSNPEKGFDCSGFVNYVFKNYGIHVPRSSKDFTKAGKPVRLADAKVGDILIFTGTNPKIRSVGHVGIVYAIDGDGIKFIHASSGKAQAVTVTEMNAYYKRRFMKAVSII